MSLRLILTRHAKSSWNQPGLDDHDRPLNRRGRDSATAIGRWLAGKGYRPELVLSSTSARTRETWALIAGELGEAPEIRWEPALYHADPEAMFDTLLGAGAARTVLLLAHNPGIGEAAQLLAQTPLAHPKFEQYPTAATTIYDIDIADWSELGWHMGQARDFVVPRELGVD